MSNMIRRTIASLICMSMTISLAACSTSGKRDYEEDASDLPSAASTSSHHDTAEENTTEETVYQPTAMYEIGDVVHFGDYMSNDTVNESKWDEWIVADKNDNELLLIANCIIDLRQFDEHASNDWSSSSICSWLNNEYIELAFNEEEQSVITDKGLGRVFLLSLDEVNTYFETGSDRIARYYASPCNGEYCWWYLRSPGTDKGVMCVFGDSVSVGGVKALVRILLEHSYMKNENFGG